ncbi:MAG: cyanophycin synthetase [Actinomycetota bacterium]|nr:cyanophycin synthetase [Actinomycetota bacterium]
MLNYGQVCKYLDGCLIFGIKPGLERVRKLLELLGNPQKKPDFIHVVGTNGKTSTTKITAAILKNHGIKTGYYISPHINSYTERIWIDGEDISEEKFSGAFNEIYPYIKKVNEMNMQGPMTQFEIITAMAFNIAKSEGVRAMVLEAGMGGRWDATNIGRADVAGLTGVSLEHTKILGNTVREISSEKVQVIKENALVATTSMEREVLKIIRSKVSSTNSRLFLYGKDFYIKKKVNLGMEGWLLDIKGTGSTCRRMKFPVPGKYQTFNLSLAMVLAELYMKTLNKKLDCERVKGGIEKIKIRGRFEIIRERPLLIADAAHNPGGIEKLAENLAEYFKRRKKIIIFAVLRDKDYENMVEKIINVGDVLILTSSRTERSLDAGKLEEVVRRKAVESVDIEGRPAEIYRIRDIKNSVKFALKISDINDIICITGSITNLKDIVS